MFAADDYEEIAKNWKKLQGEKADAQKQVDEAAGEKLEMPNSLESWIQLYTNEL